MNFFSDIFGKLRSGSIRKCSERPLGMESGAIPVLSIEASSYYHSKENPHEARMNYKYKNGLVSGVWAVAYDKPNPWIQVELGNDLTTRPNGQMIGYTKSYKLAYSDDGQAFTEHRKGVIFDGNTDRDTVVRHDLKPVIKARYIRIHPQSWLSHIALRFELFRCSSEGSLTRN